LQLSSVSLSSFATGEQLSSAISLCSTHVYINFTHTIRTIDCNSQDFTSA
jgi:hypothetical protein